MVLFIFLNQNTEVLAEEKRSTDLWDTKQLKEYVDKQYQLNMEKHHVPGAIITIVKDGEYFAFRRLWI